VIEMGHEMVIEMGHGMGIATSEKGDGMYTGTAASALVGR